MQSDDFFSQKLMALNCNMGPPPPSNSSGKVDFPGQNNGTPAMPKMGVRARVSEWPPKKDCLKSSCNKMTWDNSEVKYSIEDLFHQSPQHGLNPIRQRSNSDVTISDIDVDDVLDQNAVNPNTGAALHREYGSTSSIDRQGLSGENFNSVHRRCRVDNLEHKNLSPFSFSNVFHCDSTISPSLHAATQISQGKLIGISGFDYMDNALLTEKDKFFKFQSKSESVETCLFKRLRAVKSEHDALKFSFYLENIKMQTNMHLWTCEKSFAHYDVQSILFNINEAMATQANITKRKNITTGASAASQSPVSSGQPGSCESPLGSKEDLNTKDSPDSDEGDGKSNDLVLSCPYFRNEIGGEGDRRIALTRANSSSVPAGESSSFESSLSSHCTNAGVSVLEVPRENQPIHREKVKRYIIEHIDLGAYYYRKYFYGKEHHNYFGIDDNLGPVAVSIRREKVEDAREKEGSLFNYRIVFRTSELSMLRGAILEDAIPATVRHGTARGLPHKEILDYVIPELNIQCMRQALNSVKVPEQLLKLDEQGLSFQHKVGILYCKAGQCTEEDMYNNETAGPAFEEFLDLLGQRVRLKGFTKYRAQLDNKTDSTGTHSFYTTYKGYELMFHVSTMLPYMPSNRQQLLRKRHIGNDIVTIVFQEPGSLPFTPKTIRSHFQHVFVIVKVHNPCTENVCYSVVVSRSKDVPTFGPPIPNGVTFPKSAVFRDFLLAKVINAENAAHKSQKFRAMATRTRQEYLKDLAENFSTTATVDSSVKFSFITLGAKRKERVKPKKDAHLYSIGAIVWNVIARDFGLSVDVECFLGLSNEFVILVEKVSKNVVFNCSCRDVIGWTSGLMTIKLFYEKGESILLSTMDNCAEDIREVVQRLEMVTRGCETTEMTLRRNGLGQLGFHVNFEGIVAEVEPFGFAWKAGLRQGSRLVEICNVTVATLTHEQMIDLLRTSLTVKVVIIKPFEDGSPRRGCSEICRMTMVEYKQESEGSPCEQKPSFRHNNMWHRVETSVGQPVSRASPILGTSDMQCQKFLQQSQAAIPRSTSFDRKIPDSARSVQDAASSKIPQCTPNDSNQHYRCSPSNQSSSSDPGPSGSIHWRQHMGYDGCSSPLLLENTKWQVPSNKISTKERGPQKESNVDISPNKHSHMTDKSCSSHSSSNTLSSNASSNSDEKHFGSGDLMDPELLGLTYIKGASTDSGIDTTPCSLSTQIGTSAHHSRRRSASHCRDQMVQWNNSCESTVQTDLYSVHSYPPSLAIDGSTGDLSELSSHSSGSHHSVHCSKSSRTLDISNVYILPHSSANPLSGSKLLYTQGPVIKYVTGWKENENGPSPPQECDITDCQGEEDISASCQLNNTKMDTECQNILTKDDFLKNMIPDSPIGEEGKRKFSIFGSLSPRRMLYRTLSDESICSNRRGSSHASSRSSILDQAMSNDILFSTTPPYHSTLPTRTYQCWFSDCSLSEKSKFNDPGLIPLPDAARGLNWSHLVDAARAYEDQQVSSFCTLNDMPSKNEYKESQDSPVCSPSVNEGQNKTSTLTGKVNQLEVILRQLQTDLLKEKEDKAMLQAEVHHLRRHNMRLQEESQTASAQLRKFTEWFFSSVDKNPQ
ncbi:hypothetical protein GDO86_009639 [Hymenochirus boettgeri]|uniref:Signal-induced proliferation-associated 1-like protein 2 n=1 Tax=Hymenochirus boettgeri TaxID=247094 RepID=A0A8T2JMI2_9PIPI|nr:hypothetical protein GDO86_009639 [Hymenochirus boettgeri]KAG8444550.1 hypothetical protein GDO86_009639 [Hymenochirus boettgeri]KAG8444551.1 hypothetical protein GDO86_009639 [Hymenochirus boettgeri]